MNRQVLRLRTAYIVTALGFAVLAVLVIPDYLNAVNGKITIIEEYSADKIGTEFIYAMIFLISPLLFFIFGCISILKKNLNYTVLSLFFFIAYVAISEAYYAKNFPIHLSLMVSLAVYLSGVGMLGHIADEHRQERQLQRKLVEIKALPMGISDEAFILKKRYSWTKGAVHAKKHMTSTVKILLFAFCVYFIITAPEVLTASLPMLKRFTSHEFFKQPLLNSFALFLILIAIFAIVWILMKIFDALYIATVEREILLRRTISDFTAGVKHSTTDELLYSEIRFLKKPFGSIYGFSVIDMNYYLWLFLICALLLAGMSVSWDLSTFQQAAVQVVTNTPGYTEPETYLNKINLWLIQQEEKIGTLNFDEFIIRINEIAGGK